jgi:hypothetical protein
MRFIIRRPESVLVQLLHTQHSARVHAASDPEDLFLVGA